MCNNHMLQHQDTTRMTQPNLITICFGRNRFHIGNASSVQQICKQKLTSEMTIKTISKIRERVQTTVTIP